MSNSKQTRNNVLLNFEEWMVLAKNNPDEFEEKRREHIELFINSASKNNQHRLRGLQWQIDQTRKLSRSPMASCIEISNMMWDSLDRLKEHQYELVNTTLRQTPKINKLEPLNATILPIPTNTH
ncbi:MAG: DUF3135 domain-containing protein [Gammaproteobacteria bacterium]|nr:DUF3135 domain-containing protein [Gammaproteobacteria bacterium]